MLYAKNKRMEAADIFKAIAIFVVILCHCPIIPLHHKQLLESFVMPMFWIAMGLTYNLKKHSDKGFFTIYFIKDKFIRLIVPCYLFGLIYAQLTAKNLLYMVYGSQQTFQRSGGLSSLWFLPCCFLSVCFFELLVGILYRIKNKYMFHFAMIITALLFAVISNVLPRISMGYPWCFNVSLMGLSFIIIGYEIKSIIQKVSALNGENVIVWSILFIVPLVILYATYRQNLSYITTLKMVDFATATYGNIALYMLDALCGGIAFLALAVLIGKLSLSKVFVYVGQRTFLIFLVHKPIIIGLGNMMKVYIPKIASILGMFLVLSLVVLMISLCLTEAIRKLQSSLSGKIKL